MRFSRDVWLAIGLFIALLVVTIAAAIQQTRQEVLPAYSSLSTNPNGAKALLLWLNELGYSVHEEIPTTYRPPDNTALIFILEPSTGIIPDEWETLDTWVEDGGTLVLAGEGLGTAVAVRHYQFNMAYHTPASATLTIQTPLMHSPPVNTAFVYNRAYLQTGRTDFVTHLAVESEPVLVSIEQGQGRVILSTIPYLLSNAGLKEDGNPALALNLISAARSTGGIWFDEWHHDLRAQRTQVEGPGNWLRYTPAGHSFLYVGLIIFVALVLQGRRFGRPVPLSKHVSRRAPLEYITAIANLGRRAKHRSAVLKQYKHWLKRGLGRRYRLDPTLPDDEYLKQLNQLNPNLDTPGFTQSFGTARTEEKLAKMK